MSKRTFGLIALLGIIAIGLVILAAKQQSTQTQQKMEKVAVSPTPVPDTTLSLEPNQIIMSSPSGSVNVVVDSITSKITAVQLELSYDPKVIGNVTITPAAYFSNQITLLNTIDQKNGRISFAVGSAGTSELKKGKATIATINFQVIGPSASPSAINFLPKSLVTGEGISSSVLKSSTGTQIIVKTLPVQPVVKPSVNAPLPTNTTTP